MKLETTTMLALRPWFPDLDLSRVHIVRGGPVCWYVRHVAKQGAMTIAPYIFYGREDFETTTPGGLALLAHELMHVEQYRALGHIAFLARYLRDLAWSRFRYSRDLPLEKPCYELQARVKAALTPSYK